MVARKSQVEKARLAAGLEIIFGVRTGVKVACLQVAGQFANSARGFMLFGGKRGGGFWGGAVMPYLD